MRLAFWRGGKDKASALISSTRIADKDSAAAATADMSVPSARARFAAGDGAGRPFTAAASSNGDLDVRAIWDALLRNKQWVIGPTLLALVISLAIVNTITPRYRSEARILIDGRENVFLRPTGERAEERVQLDPEAVTSQVQLVLSRDLAREVIKINNLAENPEFDPVLRGISPFKALLGLIGIGRDPFRMTPEERVLDAYADRLTAYAVDKSRVVVIEFQSRDPDLAAKVANSIAETYLTLQQGARQNQARAAGTWLSGEIDSLRGKVADAESRVEDFRSRSSLFIGTNNTSLSNQQMGEINSQLNNARAQKSDAESKARLLREMLSGGRPIEASEALNSELMRRLSEQRVTLRAQLAEQSSTLLERHPRIKELKAQLGDLDRQIRDEAGKISRTFESDARIASARVDGLSSSLDQLKKLATSTNGQDVQLRALEREAKAQRDLLESYLAKYREATTRENIDATPSDGRIISRAIVSNTPAYPKKLPIVVIATLGMMMLSAGIIAMGELLRMTSPRSAAPVPASMAMQPYRESSDQPKSAEPPRSVSRIATPELEGIAKALLLKGAAAGKISLLGTASDSAIAMTALALGRVMAQSAKVVLVDLSPDAQTISAASDDGHAPGLSELMAGGASFGEIVTHDRSSALHLVSAGRAGNDRSALQSPRLMMMLNALMQVYDHVLLNAGTASDLPAGMLTAQARAVVVPDAAMTPEARTRFTEQLASLGFGDVTILSGPVVPLAATSAPIVAAA